VNIELGSSTGEGLFGLSAFENAYLGLAKQLYVDGETNSDYAKAFPPSRISQAGSNLLPHFFTVDGDLVAPFVAAWILRASQTGEKFTAQNFQKAAYSVVGATPDHCQYAANAAYRAMGNGRISGDAYKLMMDPKSSPPDFWGDLRDSFGSVTRIPTILVKGGEKSLDYAQYLPFAVAGLGVLYLMWFTAPMRASGKSVKEAFR